MDKKQLIQYRALLSEQPVLEQEISRLYQRLKCVQAEKNAMRYRDRPSEKEAGRNAVVGISGAAAEIKQQILIKEKRLENTEKERTEIEQFIADIPNSLDRQIFALCFLEGKTQQAVGNTVGYSRGRISQIISKCLNSQ